MLTSHSEGSVPSETEHDPIFESGGHMSVAGLCRVCGQYVWLNEQWGCVNGHPWSEISNWYDPQTGAKVTPYWLQQVAPAPESVTPATPAAEQTTTPAPDPEPAPAPVPAPVPAPAPAPTPASVPAPAAIPAPAPAPQPVPAAGAPADRLTLLADVLAAFSAYPGYAVAYGTDTDVVIDNQVADANWGIGKKKVEYSAVMKAVEQERTVYFWEILKEKGAGLSFGGFEAETTGFTGKRWGTTKEVVIGPTGKAMDYTWDYAATRNIVEDVVRRHGWQMKVVLQKKSAQWR